MDNIPTKRKCYRNKSDEKLLLTAVARATSSKLVGDSGHLQFQAVKGSSSFISNKDKRKSAIINAIITLMDSSSSESDDEEEILIQYMLKDYEFYTRSYSIFFLERTERNSIQNSFKETIANYNEVEFRAYFRISKRVFEDLCEKLSEWHHYRKLRYDKRLPEAINILVFLCFAGHEDCTYRDLSYRFNLSVSTISMVIRRVLMFLSSLSPELIRWPNETNKEQSATFFGNKFSFSKAIGCIGVARIAFDPPQNGKADYIDTKGNTTVCLQAICDENKKFINIFLGYPGSCEDNWILNNSPIYKQFEAYCGHYYLLGHSAYTCSKYLITPYSDKGHLTTAQKDFNIKLNTSRVCIEHAFNMLKQRFRQLNHCKLRGMEKVCHFIRACCVLHNISNEDDISFTSDTNVDIADDYKHSDEVSTDNYERDAVCRSMHNSDA